MKTTIVAMIVLALVVSACGGQSKSDKAKSQVCDARADISKQVDTLKGLTVSTATTSQIKSSVTAIANDLKTITNAQGDLSADRRSQVQQANKAFESQVKDIVSTLGSTTSLSSAKSQLTTALTQLADAYKQTFAKISC